MLRRDDWLETVFRCSCPDIQQLRFSISDQPSLRIRSSVVQKDQSQLEIWITAEFIKFGYSLALISIELPGKILHQIPLPFVFHNFLNIT